MGKVRVITTIVASGIVAAGMAAGTAWAGGPGGYVEDASDDVSEAVGTGTFTGGIVGFRATGDTNDEASAAVVSACQNAGGVDCTSDEVTNDSLCIVSVADDETDVVAGGAGPTIEAARADAFQRAAGSGTPFGSLATIVISACP